MVCHQWLYRWRSQGCQWNILLSSLQANEEQASRGWGCGRALAELYALAPPCGACNAHPQDNRCRRCMHPPTHKPTDPPKGGRAGAAAGAGNGLGSPRLALGDLLCSAAACKLPAVLQRGDSKGQLEDG